MRHGTLRIGGWGKSTRQIKALRGSAILHRCSGLHARASRKIGQAFPPSSTGVAQSVGSIRGLSIRESARHVDVASAESTRHVVEGFGQ